MKTSRILTVATAASILLLSGCGGDSSSGTGGTGNASGSTVQIATANDAKKAVQAISMISYSASGQSATQQQNTLSKQRIAIPNTTINCPSGGTYTSSGNVDLSTLASNVDINYNNCTMNNQTMDGKASVKSEGATGNSFMRMTNLSVDNTQFNSLMNLTIDTTTSEDFKNISSIINGNLTYLDKLTSNSGKVNYYNFKTDVTTNFSSATVSYTGSLDATSSLYPCINGKYTYQTISPITANLYTQNQIDSGELDINGADFVFDHGTITVTTTDGSTYVIDQSTTPSCN